MSTPTQPKMLLDYVAVHRSIAKLTLIDNRPPTLPFPAIDKVTRRVLDYSAR